MESPNPEAPSVQVTLPVQLLLGPFDLFTFKCPFNLKPESYCFMFLSLFVLKCSERRLISLCSNDWDPVH